MSDTRIAARVGQVWRRNNDNRLFSVVALDNYYDDYASLRPVPRGKRRWIQTANLRRLYSLESEAPDA